jgi:ribosome-associated heat shock protein Hsp15
MGRRHDDDDDDDDFDAESADGGRLRIDRCLWHLRLYKTRSLASSAVAAGRVQLNGGRPKPSREIVVGDVLEVTRESQVIEFTVLTIPKRRGPALEAQSCYRETERSIAKRAAMREVHQLDALSRPRTDGRPDKRDRRVQRDFLRRQ